jgi:hypothetical protein
MPWQALGFSGVWCSQILRQSAHECGKIVSPTHRPLLSQESFLVLISIRGWVNPRAIERPEGLCQRKIPMTPSGIDHATFWFVAQCLNHCVTASPKRNYYQKYFLGVKAVSVYGWQPYHLHVPTVLKSRSLNLLEPSGPLQACNGIALPYTKERSL